MNFKDKEKLVELLHNSKIKIHLVEKGFLLANATVILGDLLELRYWRVNRSKFDDSIWVQSPSVQGFGRSFYFWIQDKSIQDLLSEKIIQSYEDFEIENQDPSEIPF